MRGVVGPLSEQVRTLLGLETTGGGGMLLTAREGAERAVLIEAVLLAVADRRALIWHAADGGSRSRHVSDRRRALGQYSRLLDPESSTTETSIELGGRRLYSDVGWLGTNGSAGLLSVLSGKTASSDVAATFLPRKEDAAQEAWASLTIGLWWLWLNRVVRGNSPVDPDVASSVILAFVRSTMKLGGLALLVVDAEDSGRLFWIVGNLADVVRLKEGIDQSLRVEWLPTLDRLSRLWSIGLA